MIIVSENSKGQSVEVMDLYRSMVIVLSILSLLKTKTKQRKHNNHTRLGEDGWRKRSEIIKTRMAQFRLRTAADSLAAGKKHPKKATFTTSLTSLDYNTPRANGKLGDSSGAAAEGTRPF